MMGSAKLGLNYKIASPASLFPGAELLETCKKLAENSGGSVSLFEDPKEAVQSADALYTDVWVSMGEEEKKKEREGLLRPYQVNMDLMKAAGNSSAVFLHCLPAIKGYEVTEDVFEAPFSKVFDEAENRMHTIKAVMVATIGNQ